MPSLGQSRYVQLVEGRRVLLEHLLVLREERALLDRLIRRHGAFREGVAAALERVDLVGELCAPRVCAAFGAFARERRLLFPQRREAVRVHDGRAAFHLAVARRDALLEAVERLCLLCVLCLEVTQRTALLLPRLLELRVALVRLAVAACVFGVCRADVRGELRLHRVA